MREIRIKDVYIGKIVYILEKGVIERYDILNIRTTSMISTAIGTSALIINDSELINTAGSKPPEVIVQVSKDIITDNGATTDSIEAKAFFSEDIAKIYAFKWLDAEGDRLKLKRNEL